MSDFVEGPVRVGEKNLAAQVIGTGHGCTLPLKSHRLKAMG